jgi:hypothetical protein
MADQLHFNIRDFRDILLAELAKLEHGVRETIVNNGAVSAQRGGLSPSTIEHERELKKLRKELAEYKELNEKLSQTVSNTTIVNDLEKQVEELNRQLKKAQHENKALQSTCISKADYEKMENKCNELNNTQILLNLTNESLKASCSDAQGRIKALEKENAELKEELEIVKKLTSESVKAGNKNVVIASAVEAEAEEEEEIEEEEAEEELDPSTLPDLKHKGKVYKKSPDNTLYLETEEGWEEVGKWDAATKTIIEEAEEAEAEAEEEEEEEADPELTEFQYKGKIYFLDNDNNVFEETDEGYEQVGTWNGKKILFE